MAVLQLFPGERLVQHGDTYHIASGTIRPDILCGLSRCEPGLTAVSNTPATLPTAQVCECCRLYAEIPFDPAKLTAAMAQIDAAIHAQLA